MTVVVVTKEQGNIFCFSDSRVTHKPHSQVRTLTDHFTKIYIAPYRLSSGDLGSESYSEVRGEIGFAFCGDILFAVSLYAACSNIFQNLHSTKNCAPPSLHELCLMVVKVANLLMEDDDLNAKSRIYEVLLFGNCPLKNTQQIFHIRLKSDSAPPKYYCHEIEIENTGLFLIGSGEKAFLDEAKIDGKALSKSYAEIVLDAIARGGEPTIGGHLQQAISDCDGVRIVPVMYPQSDEVTISSFISGFDSESLGSVGEYTVGRKAIAYRLESAMENKWLVENGFSKIRSNNPDWVNVQAKLVAFINLWSGAGKPIASIDSYIKVKTPAVLQDGERYFLARCKPCKRPVPVLHDPSSGKNPEPFFGQGGFISLCPHCGSEIRVAAKGLVSRPGR